MKISRLIGTRSLWTALAFLLLLSILIGACELQASGETLVQEECTRCHTLAPIEVEDRTRNEWKDVVYEMIEHGAELNEREVEKVVDHLAEEHGIESP